MRTIPNKRILAISDIHGCYQELVQLLKLNDYNPKDDQLILLGDYIDRGPESKRTVAYIMKLVEEGAIALRGNHDQMFLEFIFSDDPDKERRYLMNGGMTTLETYVGEDYFPDDAAGEHLHSARQLIKETDREHLAFLSNLPYYFETEKHLFVHAGIDPSLADWKNTPDYDKIWIRHEFLGFDHPHHFTVVHGHSPTQYIRGRKDNSIFFGNKKIGIDGACAYGGRLNCLIIMEDSYQTTYISNEKA
ncbi:metallophosphoesterase family protein [Oceanobacillus sp. CFH 90083]|uniref:metallophosphoesterase family protein n=1 Tax=Oceanobacillus sp. CFH 90083 TaxID=2592336 RepID=UPI00128B6E95|nr:metallophosphoesterase family protein [Oceanobacillus sp. CFH 90083]